MAKRRATTILTHENYDDDDVEEVVPEPSSNRDISASSVPKNRRILTAARRTGTGSSSDGTHGLFTGVNILPTTSSTSSSTSSFPFAVKSNNTNGSSTASTKPTKEDADHIIRRLTSLNTSFLTFISANIGRDPGCDLTPSLEDYIAYAQGIRQGSSSSIGSVSTASSSVKESSTTTTTTLASSLFNFPSMNYKSVISTSAAPHTTTSDTGTLSTKSLSSGASDTFKFLTPSVSNGSGSNFTFPTTSSNSTSSTLSNSSSTTTTSGSSMGGYNLPFSFSTAKTMPVPTTTSASSAVFNFFGSQPSIVSVSSSSSSGATTTSVFTAKPFTFSSNSGGLSGGSSSSFTFGSMPPSTGLFAGLSGSSKPSFGDAEGGQQDDAGDEEGEYQPPKPEVREIQESDALYSSRCKLYYMEGEQWRDKGVGNLHLKPIPQATDKFQFLIRADTNLGNILLNVMVNRSMKFQVQKNSLTFACVANPPIATDKTEETAKLTKFLIRVKDEAKANELLQKIDEARGSK